MKMGAKALVAAANEKIKTYSVDEALGLVNDDGVQWIDVREAAELEGGKIPGALHAPRGMLEFHADPDLPYHKAEFSSGKRIVLYCASGGRSALAAATLQDMGLDNVAHLSGGFKAWCEKDGPVEK